ncbi:MAG: OFA family MFS transporter [Planctomycetaceae bacterium]|nr:OFA family MFS transporter [Planctomycetaceae bacterium]
MTDAPLTPQTGNRWLIAIMGTLLQLCLGTVYAWSYFQDPLSKTYGWTNTQVMVAFSLAICFLGLAAAWGGINLAKYGPRKLAMIGGTLFGLGYLLGAAGLYWHNLWVLWIGYGVIGGIGLGLGYVTPVATAAKWFPDKKGLVTGMVIMGFGFGALLMSKVLAPVLLAFTKSADSPAGRYDLLFAMLGAMFLIVTPIVAAFLKNPPAGYVPAGYSPSVTASAANSLSDVKHRSLWCIFSGRFTAMWVVFFCNIAAGISIISLQSPMIQDLYRKTMGAALAGMTEAEAVKFLAGYGATLVAISSLFNGAGRFFWGGLSDRIGRVQAFRIMLVTQIAAFAALMFVGNPWVFGALICYILLCYGGGFGTMPSFVTDVFGPKMMAVVYGVILTAWSAAGVVGPQLFAKIKDGIASFTALGATDQWYSGAILWMEQMRASAGCDAKAWYSFVVAAAFLLLGLICSLLFLSNTPFRCGRAQHAPNCNAPCLAAETSSQG